MSSLRLFLLGAVLMATAGYAEEGHKQLGAHGNSDPGAIAIIENRCLSCHNRQRIDQALNERKEMEKIQKIMEEKGALLSAQEREVLGHFWKQNPFKE